MKKILFILILGLFPFQGSSQFFRTPIAAEDAKDLVHMMYPFPFEDSIYNIFDRVGNIDSFTIPPHQAYYPILYFNTKGNDSTYYKLNLDRFDGDSINPKRIHLQEFSIADSIPHGMDIYFYIDTPAIAAIRLYNNGEQSSRPFDLDRQGRLVITYATIKE